MLIVLSVDFEFGKKDQGSLCSLPSPDIRWYTSTVQVKNLTWYTIDINRHTEDKYWGKHVVNSVNQESARKTH